VRDDGAGDATWDVTAEGTILHRATGQVLLGRGLNRIGWTGCKQAAPVRPRPAQRPAAVAAPPDRPHQVGTVGSGNFVTLRTRACSYSYGQRAPAGVSQHLRFPRGRSFDERSWDRTQDAPSRPPLPDLGAKVAVGGRRDGHEDSLLGFTASEKGDSTGGTGAVALHVTSTSLLTFFIYCKY
jgi:hypothetical protein